MKFKIAVVNRDTTAKGTFIALKCCSSIECDIAFSYKYTTASVTCVPKQYCAYKIDATVVSVNTPHSIISSVALDYHTSM